MTFRVRRAGKTETGAGVTRRTEMSSDDLKAVDLWYVKGIVGVYYETKMQAEEAARKAFIFDDADKRYARIWCKTSYQEV